MSTKYIKEGRKQRLGNKSRRYSKNDKKRLVRSKVIKKKPEFDEEGNIIIKFMKTSSRKRFERKILECKQIKFCKNK
tara:strand:- start:10 stop:240 length:231 start_codon:yes stop_codon:yes gene_type:complete